MFVEAVFYHTPFFRLLGCLFMMLSILSDLDTERGTKGNNEE